jgi:hypothetical protein
MKTLCMLGCVVGLISLVHAEPSFVLRRTIPLPDVQGRIDHFALDAAGERLFVAALGNHTVEVIDLRAGKVTRSLAGFEEPQGLAYVAEFKRLYVADGGDGEVHVFGGESLEPVAKIPFGDDADNLRYDAAAKRLYVGYGSGGLGVIDPATDQKTGNIALTGHPESFQLEAGGSRIFVNLPGSHVVGVVDRARATVTGTWKLGFVAANFPMTLDEAHHRLFVGCRMPARLLVFDTESGRQVAKLDLHGDCDDLFYDEPRRRLYASCGEGFIDVFAQTDADHYTPDESVKTVKGARSCFFDGERIFLAVPRDGGHAAEVREYGVLRQRGSPHLGKAPGRPLPRFGFPVGLELIIERSLDPRSLPGFL